MTNEPNRYPRREFLGQCAAMPIVASIASGVQQTAAVRVPDATKSIVAPRMSQVDLAREVESLLKLVDHQVVYRYSPLPAEKNTWPILKQAAAAYVAEPEDDEYQQGVESFLDGKAVLPTINERIRHWVKENEKCRKLTDQAIERGGLELPRAAKGIPLPIETDHISTFRQLAQLKAVVSRAALQDDDVAEALREAESILKFGQMLMRSECLLVDFLIALAVMGIGAQTMNHAATAPSVTTEQVRQALASLARARATTDSLKRASRVEFCRWSLPMIAGIPENSTVDELVKRHYEVYVTLGGPDDYKLTDRQREEYDRCVKLLTAILAGHKKPFDKQATVRLASNLYVQFFQELERPWLRRNQALVKSIREELSAWPPEVELDLWGIGGLWDNAKPPRKLTDSDIKRIREAVAKIDNPLGKHIVEQHTLTIVGMPIDTRHQAHVESVRIRLALRVYEKRHGRLPEELGALVQEKILTEVPRDPYDGEAFRYSAKRRVIWSVDQDGKNDGMIPEKDDPENPFDEDIELTWRI